MKSLVNIRRESLRLVRNVDQTSTSPQCHNVKHYEDGDIDKKSNRYNIEFTFDCDVRCAITIYYFCSEEITTKGATYVIKMMYKFYILCAMLYIMKSIICRYIPRDPSMNSETYYYKKGANQLFSQTSHMFDPTAYSKEDLLYNADREVCTFELSVYYIYKTLKLFFVHHYNYL